MLQYGFTEESKHSHLSLPNQLDLIQMLTKLRSDDIWDAIPYAVYHPNSKRSIDFMSEINI